MTNKIINVIKHLCFIPWLSKHKLNKQNKHALHQAVRLAEQGHQGEIVLIIEAQLPLSFAWRGGCRERAVSLFANQRVWDTAHNTGILVYVNLCARNLQLVADRGICQQVPHPFWQELNSDALQKIKTGDFTGGLCWLLAELGALLRKHDPNGDPNGNELPDQPLYL